MTAKTLKTGYKSCSQEDIYNPDKLFI